MVKYEIERATVCYKLKEKFEMTELISKLSCYGEVDVIKDKGIKFIPRDPDWPKTYFYLDGTIEIVSEEHFEDEIESFVETLTYILGADIESG